MFSFLYFSSVSALAAVFSPISRALQKCIPQLAESHFQLSTTVQLNYLNIRTMHCSFTISYRMVFDFASSYIYKKRWSGKFHFLFEMHIADGNNMIVTPSVQKKNLMFDNRHITNHCLLFYRHHLYSLLHLPICASSEVQLVVHTCLFVHKLNCKN